jgi:ankyrin repeat protein
MDTNSDLLEAARGGHFDRAQELLTKENLDLNFKNEKGHSALMLAAYHGHYELTKFFISAGADVNSVDNSSNSILMGVVFKGHRQIFEILVQAGAKLDFANDKKQTALDYAILFGHRDILSRIHQLQSRDSELA